MNCCLVLSAKANLHLMHLTMLAKTIICESINAVFVNNKRNKLCRDAETGSPRFLENQSSQTASICFISNEKWLNFTSELCKNNAAQSDTV